MLRALMFGILLTRISPIMMDDNDRSYQDICSLEPWVGRCRAMVRMWYYDRFSQQCRPFQQGGCGNNGNKFARRELCELYCLPSDSRITIGQQRSIDESLNMRPSSYDKEFSKQQSLRDYELQSKQQPQTRSEDWASEERPSKQQPLSDMLPPFTNEELIVGFENSTKLEPMGEDNITSIRAIERKNATDWSDLSTLAPRNEGAAGNRAIGIRRSTTTRRPTTKRSKLKALTTTAYATTTTRKLGRKSQNDKSSKRKSG